MPKVWLYLYRKTKDVPADGIFGLPDDNMATRADIGRKGEDIVCQYLISHGHQVLERNWRTGHLEVDLITLAHDGIHFVEVKTRVAPVMADPQENVRTVKQQRIARAAQRYLARKDDTRTEGLEAWLDVATVVLDGAESRVEYFPNAYVPLFFG